MNQGQSAITVVTQENLSSLLRRWLESYVQKGTTSDREWLESELAKILPESAKDTAEAILEVAKSIIRAKERLSKARDRGMGREEWFFRELRGVTPNMDEHSFGELVSGMDKAFRQNLPQEFSGLLQGGPTVVGAAATDWNEYSTKEKTFSAANALGLLSICGLSLVGDKDKESLLQGAASQLGEQIAYILLENKGPGAIIAISGALSEALEKKAITIPDAHLLSPWEKSATIVTMAAQTVGLTKIAYEIANGIIDTVEGAIIAYIDLAMETAAGGAEPACKHIGQAAGRFVGGLIGKVFGPAGIMLGQQIGGYVGEVIGEKTGKIIREGIQIIGSGAKKAVSVVAEKANQVLGYVGEKCGGLSDGLFS